MIANQVAGLLAPTSPPEPSEAYRSIQTVNLTGSQATISFASIPNTFKHLQIRGLARSTNASNYADLRLRCNSDTGSNYFSHYLYGDGSGVGATGAANQSFIFSAELPASSSAASIFGVSVIDILDYTSANKYKTIRSLNGLDRNGSGYIYLHSGAWANSSSAISQIDLTLDAGSFAQYSSFGLYGVK